MVACGCGGAGGGCGCGCGGGSDKLAIRTSQRPARAVRASQLGAQVAARAAAALGEPAQPQALDEGVNSGAAAQEQGAARAHRRGTRLQPGGLIGGASPGHDLMAAQADLARAKAGRPTRFMWAEGQADRPGREALRPADRDGSFAPRPGGGGSELFDWVRPQMVEIGYGVMRFEVPLQFYLRYMHDLAIQLDQDDVTVGHGLVSGTADALDELWPEFRAAARAAGVTGRDANIKAFNLLSCYNLPTDSWRSTVTSRGAPPMFFSTGWGAPYRVYRFALQLVAAYADAIQDNCTGSEYCEGFADFCRSAAKGDEVAPSDGGDPCVVSWFVVSTNNDYAYSPQTGTGRYEARCDGVARWVEDYYSGERELWKVPGSCARKVASWDPPAGERASPMQWYAVFDPGDFRYYPWTLDTSSGSPEPGTRQYVEGPSGDLVYLEAPDTDSNVGGTGGGNKVSVHPEHLAWDGLLVDYALFCARLALDYARFSGEPVVPQASQLARYALGRAAMWAGLAVHEFGHSFTGAGHFEGSDCCFEYASLRLECTLKASLGVFDSPMLSATIRFRDKLSPCVGYDEDGEKDRLPEGDPIFDCKLIGTGGRVLAWMCCRGLDDESSSGRHCEVVA